MGILTILAVWFVASVPVALIVGRLLAAKERVADYEPVYITVEPVQQNGLAH